MQIGPKKGIFLHPTYKGVKEIRDMLLGGGPISISVSMLWICSSPLRFHQIIEHSNCLSLENKHFDHNLSGGYALNWKDSWECSDVLQCSDSPTAGAGACHKSKEAVDDPLTGGEVSGHGNKLWRDDYLSSRRVTPKSEITMFVFVSEPTSVNFTAGESVRTTYVNNPGYPSSTTE